MLRNYHCPHWLTHAAKQLQLAVHGRVMARDAAVSSPLPF